MKARFITLLLAAVGLCPGAHAKEAPTSVVDDSKQSRALVELLKATPLRDVEILKTTVELYIVRLGKITMAQKKPFCGIVFSNVDVDKLPEVSIKKSECSVWEALENLSGQTGLIISVEKGIFYFRDPSKPRASPSTSGVDPFRPSQSPSRK